MIHVVAAAIFDVEGRVLIAQRRPGTHMEGLWEFPGGKVEAGEGALAALKREINEELNIMVNEARPLIKIKYKYPEREVLLDVWRVESYDGVARGHEGQEVQWVLPNRLNDFPFPAANLSIITAVNLPEIYLISEDVADKQGRFLDDLAVRLQAGVSLVQLRCKTMDDRQYKELARRAVALCHQHQATILLNERIDIVREVNADGVHLTSVQLMGLTRRPLNDNYWISASVHNLQELKRAHFHGIDFVVISPVLSTPSHPAAQPIGWAGLKMLISETNLPVYALGGMSCQDLPMAFEMSAQGVAGISNFWSS